MEYYNLVYQVFFLLVFLFIGLCLGSFSTAIIYRERSGKSWFEYKGPGSRSYCPSCKSKLTFKDLIPVFSWVFLKGQCRYCRETIPFSYPLIELTCALCAVFIFFWSGVSVLSITALLCLPFIIALIYLGIFYKSFSWRLVFIVGFIGLISFFIQIMTL